MQAREIASMKCMHKVIKMPIVKIAAAVGRHKKSIYKALKTRKVLSRGRAPSLSSSEVRHIITVLKQLISKAKTRYEVTLSMVKKAAKAIVCLKTIRRALASKGIKFRRLRTKPVLTNDDIKARFQFALKYKGKPAAWWKEHIHMIIDCKTLPAYVTSRGRSYAAQREIRGAYRKLGQGMDDAYVVSPKELKFNPGCSAVKIVAGVTVTGPSRARPFSAMLCHDKFCTLPLGSNARTSFNARPCTRAAHGSRRVSVG